MIWRVKGVRPSPHRVIFDAIRWSLALAVIAAAVDDAFRSEPPRQCARIEARGAASPG